jgi:hypothetical protein
MTMTADQADEFPGGQLCSLINLRETASAQIPLRRGEPKVLVAPGPSIVTPVTNFSPAGFALYFVNHILPVGVI